MLAVIWPASWILFVPIVIVEAAFIRRLFTVSWKRSLAVSSAANALSTLVGIPLAWLALVFVQMVVLGSAGGTAHGLVGLGHKLLAVTFQAPWLIPYESDLDWMVPAASIVLLGPFFVVSVYTERWVVSRMLSASPAVPWSWRANGATYGAILIALVVILALAMGHHMRT
jgi:hypothetical protein